MTQFHYLLISLQISVQSTSEIQSRFRSGHAQFRYIKIQPETININARLWGMKLGNLACEFIHSQGSCGTQLVNSVHTLGTLFSALPKISDIRVLKQQDWGSAGFSVATFR